MKKLSIISLIFIFMAMGLLSGCSSIEELDRVAQVSEVNSELSPRGRVINQGRNLVLEGKQSLKIALLKIKFLVPGVDYHKNSVVILSRDIFFADQRHLNGTTSAQRMSLQMALLPELFQIYTALEELKMTLLVTCSSAELCRAEQLREWIPRNISVVGISPEVKYKLSKYQPVLILSNSRTLLNDIQKFHPMAESTYWSSKWIKLPEFSKVTLSFNEWNSLIPTVTNF